MNKLFAIYMCFVVTVISIVLPLAFPTFLVVIYMSEGFSGVFISISIVTIFIEPLAITGSYVLLVSIKDIYNEVSM